jgi:hypothetical protein
MDPNVASQAEQGQLDSFIDMMLNSSSSDQMTEMQFDQAVNNQLNDINQFDMQIGDALRADQIQQPDSIQTQDTMRADALASDEITQLTQGLDSETIARLDQSSQLQAQNFYDALLSQAQQIGQTDQSFSDQLNISANVDQMQASDAMPPVNDVQQLDFINTTDALQVQDQQAMPPAQDIEQKDRNADVAEAETDTMTNFIYTDLLQRAQALQAAENTMADQSAI